MTTGVKVKPALPTEIQDYILDFLHDSRPTLKTCALVCRAWVPTSRYHLFFNITLQYVSRARSLKMLLENPNCTIQSCAHLLACLDDTPTTMDVAHVLRCLSPSSLIIQRWSDSDQQTLATFPPFPSIEHLTLHVVRLRDMARLFVIFPNVRELCINNSSSTSSKVNLDCNDILTRPSQLRSLEFSNCDLNPLLRLFMQKWIVPTNLFSTDYIFINEVIIVGEYFSMFGDVLRELRIGFVDDEGEALGTNDFTLRSVLTHLLFLSAAFCDNAGIQSLTGLRCLTIDTHHYILASILYIELLASILGKLPSPTLKRLRFDVSIPVLGSFRIKEWHRIGEVLQQKKFSHLTEVAFVLDFDTIDGESYGGPIWHVEKLIRESLPRLEERGILDVRRR